MAAESTSRFASYADNFVAESIRSIPDGVKQAVPGLNFSNIEEDPTTLEQLRSGESVKEEKGIRLVLSWLIEAVSTLIKTVTTHSDYIRFHQSEVQLKAESSVIEKLEKRIWWLEEECDEVRQRGMKGNILLSSPITNQGDSLLKPRRITDSTTGVLRNESEVEVCIRAIKAKTGVEVPEADISACHPLNRKGANPGTNYIVRFANLRPKSAWDTLAAGLLTGKNKDTNAKFTSANLYLNFQLTGWRSDLVKKVRQAKRERRVRFYGVDQNGRVTVLGTNPDAKWTEVRCVRDLNLVANVGGNVLLHRLSPPHTNVRPQGS